MMDDKTMEYLTLSDSMRMYIREIETQRDELLLFAEQAYAIFKDYEIHHINKGDETKAARNRCYKEMALKVIANMKKVV